MQKALQLTIRQQVNLYIQNAFEYFFSQYEEVANRIKIYKNLIHIFLVHNI